MSKQSEAKARQGYEVKPFVKMCSNCKEFAFDMKFPYWVKKRHPEKTDTDIEKLGYCKFETNIHCSIGGFAVKKTSSCNIWEAK